MSTIRLFLVSALLVSLAGFSYAAGKGHSHSHGGSKSSGKEKVTAVSPSHLRIGTKTIRGVKATIDILTLDEIKKDEDKLFTHKVSVQFTETDHGHTVNKGSVALRFTKDHNDAGHFINLSPAEKGFETFLFLPKKGEQHMMVAASLNGEKVRQFHFHFHVK